MEAPLLKYPPLNNIPEAINCKFNYQPSIHLSNLVIEIEQGTYLPDEWQNLIKNLVKEEISLSDQQREMFELLLKSAPSAEINRPIDVRSVLVKNAITIRYLSKNIKKWNIPAQNLNFIDRLENEVDLLVKIRNYFTVNKTSSVLIALCGLGGVGKTQLALAYVWKYREAYDGIYWFHADNKERLITEYITFGHELKLFNEDDKNLSIEERARRVKRYFENRVKGNCLLILDNPIKYEDVEDLLPTEGGHFLITSRHTEWPGQCVNIMIFSNEEMQDFAKKILGLEKVIKEKVDLLRLGEVLENLPLALAQAFAYIKKYNKTIDYYLILYEKSREGLLAKNLLPPGSSHESVSITWDISLKKMRDECFDSVELLCYCAYLHNHTIPVIFTNHLFDDKNELVIDDILRVAKEYSMISIDNIKGAFSIHGIVQQMIRSHLIKDKGNIKYLLKMITALLNIYPYNKEQMHDYALKMSLIIHLEQVKKHLEHYLIEISSSSYSETAIKIQNVKEKYLLKILLFLSDAYRILDDKNKEKILLKQALAIQNELSSENTTEVAKIQRALGTIYGALGKTEKHKNLAESALRVFNSDKAKYAIEYARTLRSLSNAYSRLGNFKKCTELLKEALKIFMSNFGKIHIEVAKTLMNLASVYGSLGDIKTEKEILEEVLKIKEQYYGKYHVEVAKTLSNLGSADGMLGNAEEERKLLGQALPILEAHYGNDHPEVGIVLLNMGMNYFQTGNINQAKFEIERAYNIFLSHPNCGIDHTHTKKAQQKLDEIAQRLLVSQKRESFSGSLFKGIFSKPVATESSNNQLQKILTKYTLPDNSQHSLEKGLRMAATNNQKVDLIEFVKAGVNVDAQDNNPQSKKTALHWGAIKKAKECIKNLLENGAQFNIKDASGKTAYDYAREANDNELLTLFSIQQNKSPSLQR